jgi:hypothetical protein
MWFMSSGVYYQFTRKISNESDTPQTAGRPEVGKIARGHERPDSVETMLIKAAFIGANPNPEVIGEGLLDYKCNYFSGNDPAGWRTDVPNYTAIVMKNVYPGIDIRYSGDENNRAGYEFVAAPGADLSQIRIAYEGAEETGIDAAGRLIVRTEWGNMAAAMRAPIESEGTVSGRLSLMAENAIAPEAIEERLDNFNAASVQLSYSTYFGGEDGAAARAIAVDTGGCAYITGCVSSANFPTQNPFQSGIGGDADAFVTKFSSAGNSLIYSTYLGGTDGEQGEDIAVDRNGNAYVTGITWSPNFPTEDPIQGAVGEADIFVTKLSSAGNSLVYSTYLGGSLDDYGQGIATDGNGSAFVAGTTFSTDFPVKNPFQTDQPNEDIFVARLSVRGSSLVYSTYLGGAGTEQTASLAVDKEGNACVTGTTWSADFPTQNAYQEDQPGIDVFVTRLSGDGSSLIYSTYLGGSDYEESRGIALDNAGNAYVTGNTNSSDFPTRNPYLLDQGEGDDIFVAKLSGAGNDLVYGTYLCRVAYYAYGLGIAVDLDECAYVTGFTICSDFTTRNAFQLYQGANDAIVFKLNSVGNNLVYSTYLGGSGEDMAWGIAVDGDGNAYVAGETSSDDFPVLNPYQATLGSTNGYDAFVTKLAAYNDSDGDGLDDDLDVCPQIPNPGQEDYDYDGVGNLCDNCPNDPNPGQEDNDFDGLGDACDNCPDAANPGQEDADGDNVGDLCDNCLVIHNSGQEDTDADRIGDACDNCPEISNTGQEDTDGDGIGDACDVCPGLPNPGQEDYDSDGSGDICDNCPATPNAGQQDTDGDGLGDACDICPAFPNPGQEDGDGDGTGDFCDNCFNVYNPGQEDTDGDEVGDVCDNCPQVYNREQVDSDGDGIGDACEYICGDVNGDGKINLRDVAYIINYLYRAGPAPNQPIDFNNDGKSNLRDVVYIINYLYRGGPAPNCP